MIVKQASILYATPTFKSTDKVKPKRLLHSHENGNDNANMKRKSELVYTKKHKMPRHNAKNKNSVNLKHLRSNVPFKIQVTP